ncbi:MAG: hypothetical protein ACR2H3_13975 [Acidimicrobiales bacterium]
MAAEIMDLSRRVCMLLLVGLVVGTACARSDTGQQSAVDQGDEPAVADASGPAASDDPRKPLGIDIGTPASPAPSTKIDGSNSGAGAAPGATEPSRAMESTVVVEGKDGTSTYILRARRDEAGNECLLIRIALAAEPDGFQSSSGGGRCGWNLPVDWGGGKTGDTAVLYGVAAPGVAKVEVTTDKGQRISTVPVGGDLGFGHPFWVVALPPASYNNLAKPRVITAYDANGVVVGTRDARNIHG